MEKQELLAGIQSLAAAGVVTKEELEQAFDSGRGGDVVVRKHLGITEILYYIGGAIVVLGIAIFVGQNWDAIPPVGRIMVTFGSAVAAYIIGAILAREERHEALAQAFHLIAAVLFPTGIAVIMDNAGIDISTPGTQTFIAGILFAAYMASYTVFRKSIFTLFSIIFGTWLFFAATSYMTGGSPYFSETFFEYRILITCLSYLFLGYYFAERAEKSLSGPLYGFGIVGFLGAALALGGWSPDQNIFWEIVFPGLAFGAMFASIHLRSKALLTFGSIYLMVYILKITGEYFQNQLGWPLALVVAGFMLIGIGYLSIYMRKRYIQS